MTEAEWLGCELPMRMVGFLQGRGSDRKLRLFVCACCRRVWHLLEDERSRQAVEIAEHFADGTAAAEDLRQAMVTAFAAGQVLACRKEKIPNARTDAADACCATCFDRVTEAVRSASRRTAGALACGGQDVSELQSQCALLRDLFGNPFRPATLDPDWLTPNVLALAAAAYAERELPSGMLDRTRLAVLADALLDAGCDSIDVLAHCRSEGPHVRGCWVIDLLLGRG